jgi:hypothetical protein
VHSQTLSYSLFSSLKFIFFFCLSLAFISLQILLRFTWKLYHFVALGWSDFTIFARLPPPHISGFFRNPLVLTEFFCPYLQYLDIGLMLKSMISKLSLILKCRPKSCAYLSLRMDKNLRLKNNKSGLFDVFLLSFLLSHPCHHWTHLYINKFKK